MDVGGVIVNLEPCAILAWPELLHRQWSIHREAACSLSFGGMLGMDGCSHSLCDVRLGGNQGRVVIIWSAFSLDRCLDGAHEVMFLSSTVRGLVLIGFVIGSLDLSSEVLVDTVDVSLGRGVP